MILSCLSNQGLLTLSVWPILNPMLQNKNARNFALLRLLFFSQFSSLAASLLPLSLSLRTFFSTKMKVNKQEKEKGSFVSKFVFSSATFLKLYPHRNVSLVAVYITTSRFCSGNKKKLACVQQSYLGLKLVSCRHSRIRILRELVYSVLHCLRQALKCIFRVRGKLESPKTGVEIGNRVQTLFAGAVTGFHFPLWLFTSREAFVRITHRLFFSVSDEISSFVHTFQRLETLVMGF